MYTYSGFHIIYIAYDLYQFQIIFMKFNICIHIYEIYYIHTYEIYSINFADIM